MNPSRFKAWAERHPYWAGTLIALLFIVILGTVGRMDYEDELAAHQPTSKAAR
jgi:hypothetical protein